jgi:hypothetical protein
MQGNIKGYILKKINNFCQTFFFKKYMDIITGEKIQFQCHHYLGNIDDFDYNPKISVNNPKNIDIDKLKSPFKNKKLIFCYTHILQKYQDKLLDIFSLFKNPFILVCHNSDHSFNKEYLILFKLKNLIKIFSQNVKFYHPKLFPLPIGISNEMDKIKLFKIKINLPISVQNALINANKRIKKGDRIIKRDHGNLKLLEDIINLKIKKTNFIYFYFDVETNTEKRTDCYRHLKRKCIPLQTKLNFGEYLKLLSSFNYAICPEGNGIDTHRFWECLYLGVKPIVIDNFLVRYFANYFPIIILKSWKDFNIHKIETKGKYPTVIKNLLLLENYKLN